MSVTNVNSFESRVSNQNFLTNYTDKYLRQSLANLGQRLSVKGDSITNSEFKISDLFPNYLGNLSQEGLAVEFTWTKTSNQVKAHIVSVIDDKGNKTGIRRDIGSSISTFGDANSSFVVKSSDNVVRNLTVDDYPTQIYLNDSEGINGSSYWHRDSAIIYRGYDKNVGKDVIIYKIVGHHDSGTYGPYDNEYIVEEVTVDGEFVDGFRVFMTNENNFMLNSDEMSNESLPIPEGGYERLAMLRLYKNPKYDRSNPGNQHKWLLTSYKSNSTKFEIGDLTEGVDDDLWYNVENGFDTNGTASPERLVNNLATTLTEANLMFSDNGEPLFKECYTLDIDEDTEDNAGWIVANWSGMSGKSYVCDNVGTGSFAYDDEDDKAMITSKLEYFVNDTEQLFPVILSVYDDVMYRDDTNLKLKQQIVAQLVLKLKEDADNQSNAKSSSLVEEYNVMFPIDYVFKYNLNSNDSSIIYSSLSSSSVTFCELGTDENPGQSIIETLDKISNYYDEDGIRENAQIILANGYDDKSALYDFTISYVDDTVISSIDWISTFVLPYVNDKGFWVINDIVTDQYARANSGNGPGIILAHDNNDVVFNPSEGIVFGPNVLKNLASSNWEKKEFATEYLDNEVNVGGTQSFTMSAWVPSDEYLKSIYNTDEYSYVSNALFVCTSSMEMEKNATYINPIHYGEDSANLYNEVYSSYASYYLYEDSSDASNSYIYTNELKNNSLTYLLGKDTLVTSMWSCYETSLNGVPHYSMTYIKRPGKLTALDFAYLSSLENYINHYASGSFSPDNYLHQWVVFTKADARLKNNTLGNKFIYPLIRNYNSTYFSAVMSTYTRAFGDSDEVTKDDEGNSDGSEYQYKNNLNLSIEFTDSLKTENNRIVDTSNTYNGRHFDITEYNYTYQDPVAYLGVDENGNRVVKVEKKDLEKKYGVIPRSIPYTKYNHEYSPNAIYDANLDDPTSSYQYPIFDLSEVLGRNWTVLNRYNMIGVDNKTFVNGVNKTVLWNAYLGFDWNGDSDKSHLKIGTSYVNPNLGTSTMIHNDSQSHLTPVETLDVDMSYVNFGGDVTISGNLRTAHQTWNYTDVPNVGRVWSSIITPVGTSSNIQLDKYDDFKNVAYEVGNNAANEKLFHTLSATVEDSRNQYQFRSKYYNDNNQHKIYKKSYLNVTKLLSDNDIITDYGTYFSGDKIRLSKRSKKLELDKLLTLVKVSTEHKGIFGDMMKWYNDENRTSIPSGEWVDAMLIYYGIESDAIVGLVDEFISKIKTVSNGYSWTYEESKDKVLCEEINNVENKKWFDPSNILTGYNEVITDEYYVDTIGEQRYNSAWYLELSTDLTDNENATDANSANKTIVGSPVQISYVDVPNSYVGKYTVKEEKKIYTYAYVDGSHKDFNYILKKSENYALPSNLDEYSYNEVWTCDGCDKCSSFSCDMIGICNKSKVHGSFLLSYGFFRTDDNSEENVRNMMNTNVFRYAHVRYGKQEDGTSYQYTCYSYYPTQIGVQVSGYLFANQLEMVKLRNEDGSAYLDPNNNYTYWVLNSSNFFEPYEEGKTVLASYVYIGSNILCDTTEEYIYDNSTALSSYFTYATRKGKSTIDIMNKEDNTQKYTCYVDNIPLVWGTEKSISVDNTNPKKEYDGVKWTYGFGDDERFKEINLMRFSYFDDIDINKDYALTYRYVNVREMLTNNTIPEFYNDRLDIINGNNTVSPLPDKDDNEDDNEEEIPIKPETYTSEYVLNIDNNITTVNLYDIIYSKNSTGETVSTGTTSNGSFTITSYLSIAKDIYEYDKSTKKWKKTGTEKATTTPKKPTLKLSDGFLYEYTEPTQNGSKFTYKITDSLLTKENTTTFDKDKIVGDITKDENIFNGVMTFTNGPKTVSLKVTGKRKNFTETKYELQIQPNKEHLIFNFGSNEEKSVWIDSYKYKITNGTNYRDYEYVNFSLLEGQTNKESTKFMNTKCIAESGGHFRYKYYIKVGDNIMNDESKIEEIWYATQSEGNGQERLKGILTLTRNPKQ